MRLRILVGNLILVSTIILCLAALYASKAALGNCALSEIMSPLLTNQFVEIDCKFADHYSLCCLPHLLWSEPHRAFCNFHHATSLTLQTHNA